MQELHNLSLISTHLFPRQLKKYNMNNNVCCRTGMGKEMTGIEKSYGDISEFESDTEDENYIH